jgi:hypothetical protein
MRMRMMMESRNMFSARKQEIRTNFFGRVKRVSDEGSKVDMSFLLDDRRRSDWKN